MNSPMINEKINICFLNKFRDFQRKANKFYSGGSNNNYFENNNDSKNKINLKIINNNLSFNKHISSRNNSNNQNDIFDEDYEEINNIELDEFPSFSEIYKRNNNDYCSAPSADKDFK